MTRSKKFDPSSDILARLKEKEVTPSEPLPDETLGSSAPSPQKDTPKAQSEKPQSKPKRRKAPGENATTSTFYLTTEHDQLIESVIGDIVEVHGRRCKLASRSSIVKIALTLLGKKRHSPELDAVIAQLLAESDPA